MLTTLPWTYSSTVDMNAPDINLSTVPAVLPRRSTHDLVEIFWGMLSPGEMAKEHLEAVVKSIDPEGTGKVGLRELVTFVRSRQGGGAGNAGKAAEKGLRRCVTLCFFQKVLLVQQ